MLFSEAMRLGAMFGRQIYCKLSDGHGGTCALGAARKAVGLRRKRTASVWPWVMTDSVPCPACDPGPFRSECEMELIVIHLNDEHFWTRERIADWVAGVEKERGVVDTVAAPIAEPASVEPVAEMAVNNQGNAWIVK